MHLYPLLKLVHVLAAILWVGGGLTIIIMTLTAGRDPDRILGTIGIMARLGNVLFTPASLLTVISGATLVFAGAWGAQPWIVAALATVFVTFGVGALYLGPTGGAISAMAAGGDRSGALALAQTLFRVARIDQTLQVTVVVLMILKPVTWTGALGIVALGLAVGLAAYIADGRRPAAIA